jgi:hypothetical protein
LRQEPNRQMENERRKGRQPLRQEPNLQMENKAQKGLRRVLFSLTAVASVEEARMLPFRFFVWAPERAPPVLTAGFVIASPAVHWPAHDHTQLEERQCDRRYDHEQLYERSCEPTALAVIWLLPDTSLGGLSSVFFPPEFSSLPYRGKAVCNTTPQEAGDCSVVRLPRHNCHKFTCQWRRGELESAMHPPGSQ